MTPLQKSLAFVGLIILAIFLLSTSNYYTNSYFAFGLIWTAIWLYNAFKGRVWQVPGKGLAWSESKWIYLKTNPMGFWLYMLIINIPLSIIVYLVVYMRMDQGI